jgi:hypothetical protein
MHRSLASEKSGLDFNRKMKPIADIINSIKTEATKRSGNKAARAKNFVIWVK